MKPPKLMFLATVAAAGALLGGCRSTLLLSADFEGDTVGRFPDFTLPGAPTGDSIRFDGPSEAEGGTSTLLVKASSAGRGLEYLSTAPSDGFGNTVAFSGRAPDLGSTDGFVAVWNGSLDFRPASGPERDLGIRLFDASEPPVIFMRPVFPPSPSRPRGAFVLSVNTNPDGFPIRATTVAWLALQTDHRISVSYNRDGRFSLQIKEGTEVTSFAWTGRADLSDPSLYFRFTPLPGTDMNYRIDDLQIKSTKIVGF